MAPPKRLLLIIIVIVVVIVVIIIVVVAAVTVGLRLRGTVISPWAGDRRVPQPGTEET